MGRSLRRRIGQCSGGWPFVPRQPDWAAVPKRRKYVSRRGGGQSAPPRKKWPGVRAPDADRGGSSLASQADWMAGERGGSFPALGYAEAFMQLGEHLAEGWPTVVGATKHLGCRRP